jgi:hypothetical protein
MTGLREDDVSMMLLCRWENRWVSDENACVMELNSLSVSSYGGISSIGMSTAGKQFCAQKVLAHAY